MIASRESAGLLNVFIGIIPVSSDVLDSVALCETKHGEHIGFKSFKDKKFDSIWTLTVSMDFFKSVN